MEKISGNSLSKIQAKYPQSKGSKKSAETPKTPAKDYELNLSKQAKELQAELAKKSAEKKEKEDLSPAEQALKIHAKKFGKMQSPGIFFVSGFDWFGASSVKGNYDGIRDMAEAVDGAKHFAWDEQEAVLEEIKKRDPKQPIILVGHSFGGDAVMEIAQELNTIENGFRKVDLLVTLDSVGMDNDFVPQNVKKNLNFLAQGNRFINDGPNIAMNYQRSEVENFLRHEAHAELDDATDIQVKILESIQEIV